MSLFGSPNAGSLISPEKVKRAQESLHYQACELKANKIADAKKSDPNDDEDWQDVLTDDEFKTIEVAENDAVLNGVYTFKGIVQLCFCKFLQNPQNQSMNRGVVPNLQKIRDTIIGGAVIHHET